MGSLTLASGVARNHLGAHFSPRRSRSCYQSSTHCQVCVRLMLEAKSEIAVVAGSIPTFVVSEATAHA